MKYLFYTIAGVVIVLFVMSVVSAIMMVIQLMLYVGVIYGVGWLIYKAIRYFTKDTPPE